LGYATRLSSYLTDHSKSYWTRVKLGATTDTLDADGEITSTSNEVPQDRSEILQVTMKFLGNIQQVPPMYSARKVSGKKLYQLARAGKQVDRESRSVTIHSLEVDAFDPPDLDLKVTCSKGTYIRVLADDIGRELGCGAHVSVLRRTAVGNIGLNRCKSLEDLADLSESGDVESALIEPNEALSSMPGLSLSCEEAVRFGNGNPVSRVEVVEDADGLFRAVKADGTFLGIGCWVAEESMLRPVKVFNNSNS
jgi:tRNA pseudouridine55 synthase